MYYKFIIKFIIFIHSLSCVLKRQRGNQDAKTKQKKRGIFAADRYYIWSICSGFRRLGIFLGGGAFYWLLWGSFVGILVVSGVFFRGVE